MNMENALIRAIRLVSFFFMVACLLSPRPSFSQTHIELTPSISVGETYDDNIDLEADNEKSDYITTVSPGLELHVLSEKTDFGLRYAPTFVWYADYDDNNTTRHSGALTLLQDLSQNWRLELSDTYIQSEEPIEETEGITGVRRTRNTYQRNAAHVDFRYSFGPENVLNFGYRHSLLENDDVTLDDSTEQSPYASMTYWFNTQNGMELSYSYVTLDFSRDDNSIPGDDYTGHAPGIRYLRRFSPHSTGFAGYTYTTRNFDGVTENYDVHDGSVGIEHAFSPELSLTADLSYFIRKSEFSDDDDGPTFHASLVKGFERGSLTFGGDGGWDETYMDAEDRGFTKFWGAMTRLEYRLLESLNGHLDGSYRWEEDDSNIVSKTWRGNCGLSWDFHRWFSLALDYTYTDRDDDIDTDDYAVNRVMLRLTGSRLFRW